MRIKCNPLKPQGFDPEKHKFKSSWVRRFCKMHSLLLRRKNNVKCSSAFERIHTISNYDHWLIYQWQDPENYDDPYFTREKFVQKDQQSEDEDSESSFEETSTSDETSSET